MLESRSPGRPVASSVWSTSAATLGAFGTYFCMYGLRKPFTAGSYADIELWGAGFKEWAVTAQVLGYMLSKFLGVKIISEMRPSQRLKSIWLLVAIAEVALLLFAVVPPPWNILCLFLNGLPLGLIFGLVLGFLEGRRTTEALTAVLCASFILADGVVKSLGTWLLQNGVPTFWMPFTAGALFLAPMVLFLGILKQVGPPTEIDVAHRSSRPPMTGAERRAFLARYALGLASLVSTFLLITVLRSIRADFQPEIFLGLGVTVEPGIYARSELWVAGGVMLLNGLCIWITNNRLALLSALGISLFGVLLIPLALLGLRWGLLGPFPFMVLVGLGLYLPYVAFHTTIFERLIAATQERANLGFLIYLADSVGYGGYVVVMLGHGIFAERANFATFFQVVSWIVAALAGLCLLTSLAYFWPRQLTCAGSATHV